VPNVTIEVRKRYTKEQEEALIDAVHAALMDGIKSPEWDRNLFSGRSLNAKKAFYRAIVNNLGKLGIPADHVKVLLRESAAENWGVRGGVPASEVDLGFKVEV